MSMKSDHRNGKILSLSGTLRTTVETEHYQADESKVRQLII